MHLNRLFFCLALLFIGVAPALGQGGDDGSLYSRYGLGELRSFASSRAQAMGGGGTALWSLNYANYANPASLSRQFLVRASGGVRFDNITTSNAASERKRLLAGSFSAIQFGLPLISNRLGLGFAFEPYSRVNYRVTNTGTLDADPTRDPTPFTVINRGDGGLQQIRVGVGVRPLSVMSVGLSLSYLFGIVEESRLTAFDSILLLPTKVSTSTRMRGLATTLGTIIEIPVGENRDVSVAGVVTFPANLNATRTQTLGESLDLDTLGTVATGDVNLPVSIRAGVALSSNSRWAGTIDLRYEPWTQFESGVALAGYTPDAMRDRMRVSAGVEFLPAGGSPLESYLARTAYRIGFYQDNAYISPQKGEHITTRAMTAGVSLPTLFGGTRLDVNVHVGLRGSASGILVQDRFVLVSATLNIGERWFLKRRLG